MQRVLPVSPDDLVRIYDIGAMPEGTPRYTALTWASEVHAFEPAEEARDKIKASGMPWIIHPYCLGDGQVHPIHLTRYPGCSSLFEPDPDVLNLFSNIGTDGPNGNFAVIETQSVQTFRLDDLGLPLPHMMKLDVQGAELMILEHGLKALQSCVVIEMETEFLPLYRGQPLYHHIAAFMERQGFVLHKMLDVAGRCFRPVTGKALDRPLSQVLWCDSVFIRDPRQVGGMSDAELTIAATLMAEVYRSHDLVVFYLAELDRRHGSDLSMTYLRALASGGQIDRLYFTHRGEAVSS